MYINNVLRKMKFDIQSPSNNMFQNFSERKKLLQIISNTSKYSEERKEGQEGSHENYISWENESKFMFDNNPLYEGSKVDVETLCFLLLEIKHRFKGQFNDSLLLTILILLQRILPTGNNVPLSYNNNRYSVDLFYKLYIYIHLAFSSVYT